MTTCWALLIRGRGVDVKVEPSLDVLRQDLGIGVVACLLGGSIEYSRNIIQGSSCRSRLHW
jgi:hypothetical protein